MLLPRRRVGQPAVRPTTRPDGSPESLLALAEDAARPPWRTWVRRACLGLAVWFAVHTAAISAAGLSDDVVPADVAVVLGSKVELNGVPSVKLATRLDRGLELYRSGTVEWILVSGGLGVEGHEEADVMAAYLIGRGVPEDRVLRDRQGWTTWHTAVNARRILDQRGLHTALAVTSWFHVPRTELALRRAGVQCVGSAKARVRPALRDPYSLVREFPGYYLYLVRPYDDR